MHRAVLICALLVGSAALAQQGNVTFKVTDLGHGLTMLEGQGGFTGGNLGLSTGADGVVLIDDSMPPFQKTLLEAIAQVTDQPIDYVINTHVHADHTGGNAHMGELGATIVAHENLRARLLAEGIDSPDGPQPAPAEALPVITFSDRMTFHVNGEDATVFHVHHAHTDGDAVIHFKGADVIHTGDTFFNGLFPYIDMGSGGSVNGMIAAQKQILELAGADTKIIPGHGPLANRAELVASISMLIDARATIVRHIERGDSVETALAADPLAKYQAWSWGFIDTERMVRQLYSGLGGE